MSSVCEIPSNVAVGQPINRPLFLQRTVPRRMLLMRRERSEITELVDFSISGEKFTELLLWLISGRRVLRKDVLDVPIDVVAEVVGTIDCSRVGVMVEVVELVYPSKQVPQGDGNEEAPAIKRLVQRSPQLVLFIRSEAQSGSKVLDFGRNRGGKVPTVLLQSRNGRRFQFL